MKLYCLLVLCSLFLFQACIAQQKSRLIEAKQETQISEILHYYLYFPKAYDEKPEEFPLLLFLHGGGESGDSLSMITSNGPPKLITEGKEFPFLILAPQNPHKKQWWNTRAVAQLLDSMVAKHRIDKKRVYLTGLSRGGGAAWEMAVQYPDKFAAMAVVCGMTPVPYAAWINKELPIWVFHGDKDKSIPISESINMVEKLKSMDYNVKLTTYEGVGHNSWERAYASEALYSWFMEQKQK